MTKIHEPYLFNVIDDRVECNGYVVARITLPLSCIRDAFEEKLGCSLSDQVKEMIDETDTDAFDRGYQAGTEVQASSEYDKGFEAGRLEGQKVAASDAYVRALNELKAFIKTRLDSYSA